MKTVIKTSGFKKALACLVIILMFPVLSPTILNAHDPIFGVGPRTIWQYGYGFEIGYEYLGITRHRESKLTYHTMFGATEDLTFILETHQELDDNFGPFSSPGEVGLRGKYRFFKQYETNGIYHISAIGGANLPTNGHETSSSYFGGIAAAYEGRSWLLFATGRYKLGTPNDRDVDPGDAFLYDLAVGYRPIQTNYYNPDVVIMGELNGQVFGQKSISGQPVEGSRASRLLAGFGTWITYRNWAFKPGVQVPVYNTIKHQDFNIRLVASIEIHL